MIRLATKAVTGSLRFSMPNLVRADSKPATSLELSSSANEIPSRSSNAWISSDIGHPLLIAMSRVGKGPLRRNDSCHVVARRRDRAGFRWMYAYAIAESVQRPSALCVPVKTNDQLDLQAIYRVRSRVISDRTAVINQIRSFLLDGP